MLDVKKFLTKILLRLNNYTKVVETQTITAFNKTWTFRRIGNIVFIDASGDMSGTVAAGFTNIGTLNASLRPGYNVYLKCTNANADIRLYVYPSGQVTFYHPTATSGATNCGFSGYSFIVGGYFITAFMSTLVRGWQYVRCEGVVKQHLSSNLFAVCKAILLDKLGRYYRNFGETWNCRSWLHMESSNSRGRAKQYRHTSRRMETYERCGLDSEGTEQQFKWCRDTLYNQYIWCVHRLQLRFCMDEQGFKHNGKFYVYSSVISERGCA